MEQIETQASDLRYLAQQTPVALSDSASVSAAYETPQPQPLNSPGSASAGLNSAPSGAVASASLGPGANKRKSEDDAASKQTRSKRNRVSGLSVGYANAAC